MLRWYRRHSQECEYGPEERSEEGLREKLRAKYPNEREKDILERVRYWKSCDCQIWWCGTWSGKTYPRESLGVNNWKIAEEMIAEKMTTKAARNAKLTLKDALDKWHADCELAGRAPGTIQEHRERGAELLTVVGNTALLAAVDSEAITALRMRWVNRKLASSTQYSYMAYLSGFFNFCRDDERAWIERSPMPPLNKWPQKAVGDDREETLPLDSDGGDENYQKILATVRGPRTWRSARPGGHRKQPPLLTGERLALFLELMYETGLRISDAIMFRPGKLALDSEVAQYTYLPIKTARTRKTATTYMPLELAKRLRELLPLSPGFPFWDGARDREKLAETIRLELRKVGRACGVADVKPHRFRDSFAVNALNRGVPIEAVSRMLGHKSIKTTEEFYAPWVKSRNEYVRAAYVRSRREADTPNVLEIPRKRA